MASPRHILQVSASFEESSVLLVAYSGSFMTSGSFWGEDGSSLSMFSFCNYEEMVWWRRWRVRNLYGVGRGHRYVERSLMVEDALRNHGIVCFVV